MPVHRGAAACQLLTHAGCTMSTRRQQRKAKQAKLRELQTTRPKLPAPKEVTPRRWIEEPFYLIELGLHKEPFVGNVPRFQEGVIIKIKW